MRRLTRTALLVAAGTKLPDAGARTAILRRWTARDLEAEKDLAAAQAALLLEVGQRAARCSGLRAIAAQHLVRKDEAAAHATLVAALAEARRGSKAFFDETVDDCAAAWAAR